MSTRQDTLAVNEKAQCRQEARMCPQLAKFFLIRREKLTVNYIIKEEAVPRPTQPSKNGGKRYPRGLVLTL